MEYVIAGGCAALIMWLGRGIRFAWWLSRCDLILAELLCIHVDRSHLMVKELRPQLQMLYENGATPRAAANAIVEIVLDEIEKRMSELDRDIDEMLERQLTESGVVINFERKG